MLLNNVCTHVSKHLKKKKKVNIVWEKNRSRKLTQRWLEKPPRMIPVYPSQFQDKLHFF